MCINKFAVGRKPNTGKGEIVPAQSLASMHFIATLSRDCLLRDKYHKTLLEFMKNSTGVTPHMFQTLSFSSCKGDTIGYCEFIAICWVLEQNSEPVINCIQFYACRQIFCMLQIIFLGCFLNKYHAQVQSCMWLLVCYKLYFLFN